MNEGYMESKMYSGGFGSYIDLTTKAHQFLKDPSKFPIKLYETNEMRDLSMPTTSIPSTSTGSNNSNVIKISTNQNM